MHRPEGGDAFLKILYKKIKSLTPTHSGVIMPDTKILISKNFPSGQYY